MFFLWFLCQSKNIKAKSFNLRIHHKQIINHLNNPLFSHLYKVEFFLKFIQRPQPSTFTSRATTNTANDMMAIKTRLTQTQPKLYIQNRLSWPSVKKHIVSKYRQIGRVSQRGPLQQYEERGMIGCGLEEWKLIQNWTQHSKVWCISSTWGVNSY